MKTNAGHRDRVKKRFDLSELRTFSDYEFLELLLFYVVPRKDTKQIARDLMAKFGTLNKILSADKADITAISGLGESAYMFFKMLLDLESRLLLPVEHKKFDVLSNFISVVNYCRLTMAFKKTEHFRVLYLNKKNQLIADEVCQNGTVDMVHVYPREIAKKVLEHGACSIILVHNHPSGDPSPSSADIEVTKAICASVRPLGALVHDHIIIAANDSYSFRQNKLIV